MSRKKKIKNFRINRNKRWALQLILNRRLMVVAIFFDLGPNLYVNIIFLIKYL